MCDQRAKLPKLMYLLEAVDGGLLLRADDAQQFSGQVWGTVQEFVNAFCLTVKVWIMGADNDSCMIRSAYVEPDEVAAVHGIMAHCSQWRISPGCEKTAPPPHPP